MAETTAVSSYLFQRIRQTGVEHIFGVPGDFNLQILDHVVPSGLKWVGCCNELNAAYAADGYARASKKIGVVITTYGVGEMSAINGVSGASSENIPVVHIIGQTPRFAQDEHRLLHHSTAPHGLKPNNHELYMKASKPLCVAWEQLWDPALIPDQIDRVLGEVLKQRAPGVIYLPIDLSDIQVSPLNLTLSKLTGEHAVHPRTDEVVNAVLTAFSKAKNPVIVNDDFVKRFNVEREATELLERTGSWGFTTLMGKSTFDESHPQFVGTYNGKESFGGVAEAVEVDADLVICLGPHISDFNSGFYTRAVPNEKRILLHPFYASIFGDRIAGVNFVHVLERLLAQLPKEPKKPSAPRPKVEFPKPELKGKITQNMWPALVSKALTPGCMLAADTGTYQLASGGTALPKDADYMVQLYYGSIGWALPATFGAAIGKSELKGNHRVVLVEGDGSAQMTIQELSSIVRFNLPVTVLLMNNHGYTIERVIWGEKQPYNDINENWRWTELFRAFGAAEGATETYKITTAEEAIELFTSSEFRHSTKPQLVEVMLEKFDYPNALVDYVNRSRSSNKKSLQEWEQRTGFS